MTVLSLTQWESPYLGKTVFILRQGPGPVSYEREGHRNLHEAGWQAPPIWGKCPRCPSNKPVIQWKILWTVHPGRPGLGRHSKRWHGDQGNLKDIPVRSVPEVHHGPEDFGGTLHPSFYCVGGCGGSGAFNSYSFNSDQTVIRKACFGEGWHAWRCALRPPCPKVLSMYLSPSVPPSQDLVLSFCPPRAQI